MPRILQRVAREPGQIVESDLWQTPPDLFAALNREFHFTLDCAADATNHLCDRWLGPGGIADDALAVKWREQCDPAIWWTPYGFLNPPYSSALIAAFIENVVEQTRTDFNVVALLPDTHDTRWYRHLKWASEIRRIPHRVPYLKRDGTTRAGAMFPSCVAIFRPQPGVVNPLPRVVEWTWRNVPPAPAQETERGR